MITIHPSTDANYIWEIRVNGALFPIRYLGLPGAEAKARELQLRYAKATA